MIWETKVWLRFMCQNRARLNCWFCKPLGRKEPIENLMFRVLSVLLARALWINPTLQLPIRYAFLSAAWSDDGRVALSGIEQGNSDPIAGDLRCWQLENWKNRVAKQNSTELDFSLGKSPLLPDGEAFLGAHSL